MRWRGTLLNKVNLSQESEGEQAEEREISLDNLDSAIFLSISVVKMSSYALIRSVSKIEAIAFSSN